MTGLPLGSRRGVEASEGDLTTTHEAMGRREAASGGSSKMYLDGETGWGMGEVGEVRRRTLRCCGCNARPSST